MDEEIQEDVINHGINITAIAKAFNVIEKEHGYEDPNKEIEDLIVRILNKLEQRLEIMGPLGDAIWCHTDDYDKATIENDLRSEIKKYGLK